MTFTFLAQSVVDGVLTGGVYALIATGLTLIFGVMNIINFAHGSFMMLGMYGTYFLFAWAGIDPYASVAIILPLFFVIGYTVQKGVIQRVMNYPGEAVLLLTMGIMLIIENLALAVFSPNYRIITTSYASRCFYVMGLKFNLTRLVAFLFAILVGAVLYLLLKNTYLGKAIRAVSQEREGALTVGINFNNIFCVAFGIGIACVAVAGAVVTPFLWISPNIGFHYVLLAFATVVLGGMGNFIGAIFGGLIIGVVEALGAAFLSGSMKDVVVFAIFALVLLYKPQGLFGK